jgi:hypothetical protein
MDHLGQCCVNPEDHLLTESTQDIDINPLVALDLDPVELVDGIQPADELTPIEDIAGPGNKPLNQAPVRMGYQMDVDPGHFLG